MIEEEFLSADFRERVRAVVERVEAQTGAELVVCVRPRCATYEGARHLTGALLGFMVLLFLLFHPFEVAIQAMPSAVFFAHVLGYWLAGHSPWLMRRLTPRRVREGHVKMAAKAAFLELGVIETKQRVGVLVFLSLLERQVELLGDRGLAPERLGDPWERATLDLRKSVTPRPDPATFLSGVEALGPVLAHAVPRHDDDHNELPDMPGASPELA